MVACTAFFWTNKAVFVQFCRRMQGCFVFLFDKIVILVCLNQFLNFYAD